jgi:hypothetical protein
MAGSSDWREVYKAAREELAPAKKLELCQDCRRLIQEQLAEHGTNLSSADRETLEEALRSLWSMEQEIRNPRIH